LDVELKTNNMAFKLRSGNGPLKFKMMGSSPVRNSDPVKTPDSMREHYGSYKEYAKEYEGMVDENGNPVQPMSVEDWNKLNNANIEKAHFPDNKYGGSKFSNYLGWSGDAVREKHAIQKERGTYEEFRFTAAMGDKLVRDGTMTQKEVNAKLEEQRVKDKQQKTNK